MWPRRCKQNLLTLQATCSFVFDYSTRRLLDLLSKGTPAGGIPLGGTLTFQFCTLALGNSQVGTPGSLADLRPQLQVLPAGSEMRLRQAARRGTLCACM